MGTLPAPEPWDISAYALGPVSAETPFDLEALSALLPGYTLTEAPSPDGSPFREILAAAPHAQEPGLVFLGHAETPNITGVRVREAGRIPNAWLIGSAFSQTLFKPDDCFTASDVPGREGDIFAREAGELTAPVYWFRTGLADTNGVLPDAETLGASTLYEISWVAWSRT
ncbi:hypothetical protein [Maricaulis parjimensis]|uniref:hypothetical protein n=1 Tax=Maricaulis parjimensis TaxID=144023 RepID=UPI0019395A7C|nr:hypothetical protein [Maricaulis parjimensis]